MVATAKPKPDKIQTTIKGLVASWRGAWEAERLNDYISHYHPAFSNKGKNLLDWKCYKRRLNKRYKKIPVSISDLKVKGTGNKAFAHFKQRYRTESYDAEGYKRLEFRKMGAAWKIFRERSYSSKPSGWPK